MATDIVIPQLGESISEGVISQWLKGEGEYVNRDEPLLELETDKITMEVPSPVAGVVSQAASEGDTVKVGTVVGAIDESATKPAATEAPKAAELKTAAATPASAPKVDSRPTIDRPGEGSLLQHKGAVQIHATPLAKKLAEEHNIDLSQLANVGTGPSGRIREHDVTAHLQTRNGQGALGNNGTAASAAPATNNRGIERIPMTKLRQTIASRLVESQRTAAMLTTFNECDMTKVMGLRSRLKESFQETHNVKLGFMSFFVKAAVSALQKFPDVNSFIADGAKGPEIERHDYCDIAVAVGTPKGLVVPVLRNCESLNFAEVESGILELAGKARDGKLSLNDMQGGTFTISNGGVYGSMLSTPILNPPQSGILGMHNIIKRPVEHPDKPGEIALRPMMFLALSYDHRIVDGAGAVGFLKHMKECLEDPGRLLLGV